MKILHLMAGLGEASGVANIARRFARVQQERGDTPKLLAPAFKWNPIYFGLVFALRAWWNARKADEIWVHCSWTFPVWCGAFLARRRWRKEVPPSPRLRRTGEFENCGRRPKLVVVPEGSFDPKRMNNHAGWKKRLVAPLDRWVLRQADEVLALCPDEVEWVKDFEPSAKVCLEKVPTFFDGIEVKVEGQGQRRMSPLRVLFLGRATDPLKGVRFLERAVAEINGNFHCPHTAIDLRVVSDHFGEELERDWEWCDVLCLPTLSDNFGLVVAEALERGKRVITTDGAPAWAPPEATQVEKVGGGGQWMDRLLYLRGFRDGADEARVRLLKDALIGSRPRC